MRGAGLLGQDPYQVDGQRGGGALVVAEHEQAAVLPQGELLDTGDLDGGGSLGLRPGEHPVDG